MSKQIVDSYVFDPVAGTVTLPDYDIIDAARLALITNVTAGVFIFNFADPSLGATISGNVISLEYDTSAMSATDAIRIDYDVAHGDQVYDRTVVGNSRTKFRDGFATQGGEQPNPDTWELVEDVPGTHILNQGGDSSGSSYLRISLSPFVESNGLAITSKSRFRFPMRVGFGVSMSQRIQGQEAFVGMVACDKDGTVPVIAPVADKAVTGATASITSNVATFTLVNHGLKGADRINILGCADKRMNVGPVSVSVLTADTFTVPITIANGTYSTVGGIVRTVDPFRYVKNAVGLLFENTNAGNASFVARRNGAKFRSLNSTIASTTGTQTSTSPFTDAFNSAGNQELYLTMDEVAYRSYASDSTGTQSGMGKFTQSVPDEELEYKIQVRARTLAGFTKPVGRIVSATKTASTTVTVTTDADHGLAVGDFVQIYGARDQTTLFGQLGTQTAVASVISATQFTIVWGISGTGSTAGGTVWLNQGQVAAPGIFGQAIQSMSRTNGVLTLIGSANWSGPLSGEYANIHGLEPSAAAYEGAYKILRISTTTMDLESPGPDFSSITTGGNVIRRTDIRLHFARVMDYTRLGVEVLGGKGNTSDINNSTPVSITGSATVPISGAPTQGTGVNTTAWNAAGWGGFLVNDIASAAITSTATSSAITPGSVANVGTYSHTFHVAVTAVSGTTPTMDIGIEESADNGTNWVRVYDFPRITANGSYQSPQLRATLGTRYRYVRTIAGTTPSFTMSLNRVQWSSMGELVKQFFDRSIVLTTLNSVTPTYFVDSCNTFQVIVNLGAATTAPVLQFQGSEDGTNWYAIGSTFTPTASTTTVQVYQNIMPKFVRVIVATAGATVTPGYISIKALNP